MIQGTIDSSFVVMIWITMRTLQIRNLGNMGLMSCLSQGVCTL